ncbi:unnamed protein product [Coregonus sp. 'balchen']|nr:unnamed protein product [Coregonus sp. 'balchen']
MDPPPSTSRTLSCLSTGGYTACLDREVCASVRVTAKYTHTQYGRRQEYLHLDIAQLLTKQGINSNLLMPQHQRIHSHLCQTTCIWK